MDGAIRVAVIYGSTREGRFCDTVVHWVAAQIWSRGGFTLDLVDPGESAWPRRHEFEASPALEALSRRLHEADAFVVVTPEHNHGYPASLKYLMDMTSRAWRAKPVAFVSYGGISGGLRAVEQLRQVVAELHAMSIRHSTSFAYAPEQFDAEGQVLDERALHSISKLLSQLRWWAVALREARRSHSYEAVAA